MKVAICDDELEIREQIEQRVKRLYPDSETVLCECGDRLLELGRDADIIFLDIQMDGMNGMEAAKRLRAGKSNAVLIFITALEEYVFQAFDVGAFHYLLKPFDRVKFIEVLRAAVKKSREDGGRDEPEEKSILVKKGATTRKVFYHEICYAEVYNRKILLHLKDGKLEYYGKLKDLEQELGETFARPHRAFLVNLRYVLKYNNACITMEDGETVLMSKQKYAEFVKRYLKYSKKEGADRGR